MKVLVHKYVSFIAWMPRISRDNVVDVLEAFVSPSPLGTCHIGPEFTISIDACSVENTQVSSVGCR